MSFDANIIDNTDELPVSDNYSSPTGRTFVWPEGDVINCIQRKPDLLWKRCKEMEQIAEMEEHRSKVSGKMNFRNVDEQICMDRYSILVVNLPIRVEPLLLAEAVDENMQPYIFEHPYPYAEIIYLRKDLQRIILRIMSGDGKFIGFAYDLNMVWEMWSENGCIYPEHWNYMKTRHTFSGHFVNEFIYKPGDDRLYRGWDTTCAVIATRHFLMGRENGIIPKYFRNGKDIPSSLIDQLSDKLGSLRISSAIVPFKRREKTSDNNNSRALVPVKKSKKTKSSKRPREDLLFQDDPELSAILDQPVSNSSSQIVEMFKTMNSVCFQRDKLLQEIYKVNDFETLRSLYDCTIMLQANPTGGRARAKKNNIFA